MTRVTRTPAARSSHARAMAFSSSGRSFTRVLIFSEKTRLIPSLARTGTADKRIIVGRAWFTVHYGPFPGLPAGVPPPVLGAE